MNTHKFSQKIGTLLTILPIVAYGLCYNNLPEEIPSHWDIRGNIDGYSSKNEFLLLALCPLFLWLTFMILPKIDPKKENYEKFSVFYHSFTVVMVLFMDFVFLLCLYASFQEDSSFMSELIPISVGVLFIFIGNYLPKVKPNFFIGIRTPWTLSSESVWIKTHRKGGLSFLLLGIFMLMIPFLPPMNAYIFTTIILLAVLYPTALSYLYFVQERKQIS